MKRDQFTQYPHIEHIDEVPAIFDFPEVIATEKVHGSSMRIGMINGVLHYGGRRLEFSDIRPESKEGQGFVSWALATGLDQRLREAADGHDVILYGEWHGSGTPAKGWPQIQKGIRYLEGNDFRLFDIKVDGKYVPQNEMVSWAHKIGLKTMPILYRGKPDQKTFDALIDTMSRVGEENGIATPENTLEGVVIRPLELHWAAKGKPVMAKYKVGKWAERASQKRCDQQSPQPRPETPPNAIAFAQEFVTETRLDHVLDQLREGNIPIDKTALGEVMKRMGQDIKREGAGELERTGLEWKDVSPLVTKLAKELFIASLAAFSVDKPAL